MPESVPLIDLAALKPFCRSVSFRAGIPLRLRGQHYRDMYVVTDGSVEIDLGTSAGNNPLAAGPGSPIGEIGFLRGSAATATVNATTPVAALVIDDSTLAYIEKNEPALAAHLLHYFADTAVERTSFNLTLASAAGTITDTGTIEVYLCRGEDMLESAKRLRYEVYCEELGRSSPYADHEKKTISDELDRFGNTFIAVEAGETIGTLRSNLSRDGPLGHLEEVYGMRHSPDHPQATAICTKFIVKKPKRGGSASIKLISAMVGLGLRSDIRACYVDTISDLIPYYEALGFTSAGRSFFHRENGPSYPMVLDVAEHGEQLSTERGARAYLKAFAKAEVSRARSNGTRAPGHNGKFPQ